MGTQSNQNATMDNAKNISHDRIQRQTPKIASSCMKKTTCHSSTPTSRLYLFHISCRYKKAPTLSTFGTTDVLVSRVIIMVRTDSSMNQIRTIDLFEGNGALKYAEFINLNHAEALVSELDLKNLQRTV